ncbi:MAG TPA: GvpL/GvpF family gas vesicle protein [Gemmatimonadaceae bacterium]|jgi:hypothetical protein|nr:GvpL/GvpF family gas vesicle protein [Gemmatimonadaceae bacterium]
MTTHLYCILPREPSAPIPNGLVGIGAAPVRTVTADGVVGWVSDTAAPPGPSIDGIRAHNDVVQAALDTGTTPAPVRFGHRFADDAACRDALDRIGPSIADVLSTLQGYVEMTLILTPSTGRMLRDLQPVIPQMFADEPGTGKRYLETLRAREAATGSVHRAMDTLTQRLSDAVQRIVKRSSTHEDLTRMPLRTISHLVARDLVDAYRNALAAVKAGSEFRFLVVGPRAPYSFCGIGASGEGHHGIKLAD